MAPSHDDPLNSSSGEEEEDVSSEEEEEVSESESESEPETDKTPPSATTTTTMAAATKSPSASSSSSDDDEQSESESDSDSPPKISSKPDPSIKPIASKPMDKPVTKPRSKPSASSSSPIKSGKRPAPVPKTETPESKKAKKSGDDVEDGDGAKKTNGDDAKKMLFQRIWSEEDEIVVLKGMSDYTAKYKADPIADMNAFHGFIIKSVHFDVTKAQLTEKVGRLKKKYENNFKREKNLGKERTFSNPHEQICYNLSKKVWGSNGSEDSNVKVDNKVKSSGTVKRYQIQKNGSVLVPADVDEGDEHKGVTAMEVDTNVQSVGPVLSGGTMVRCKSGGTVVCFDSADQMIKNGWKLVTGPKKTEWEKKRKMLMEEEVELYAKRLELMHEQAKLVSEAMKSAQE